MSPSLPKRYTHGTHRVCPPEETLARVTPLFAQAGITRVADITRLDDLGIPVFQSVRPNSRSLSVTQGKGLTPTLAKVSAIMESIEQWHAEEVHLPVTQARVRELAPELGYDPARLSRLERNVFHPGLRLDWVPALALDTGRATYVPRGVVTLDFALRMEPGVLLYPSTSNGLASGNVREEAALHALLEVIERDSLARAIHDGWPRERFVDPATLDSPSNQALLERFAAAGVEFLIYDATGPTGLPCFRVTIWSPSFPEICPGSGCHLDKHVALSRALTEAAQTRLSAIAGARDDLVELAWRWSRDLMLTEPATLPRLASLPRDFRQIPSLSSEDLQQDLALVVRLAAQQAGTSPLLVDLSRPEVGIAVVYVIVPGFQFSL